jgi:hypothetical protein
MTVAIDNERTKLSANALDRSSTACLAVGIFAPLATLLQGPATIPALGVAMSFVGWLAAGIVLHLGARRMLGGLKP